MSTSRRRNSRGGRRQSSGTASLGNNNDQNNSTNIRVVVRIRPPNAVELENGSGSRPVVQMLDEKLLVFDPKEESLPSYFHGRRVAKRNFMRRKNKDIKFAFDHVFGERVTQEFVYENTTKTIVDNVLAGYNASVFAYGATGAGKTFTMLGAPDCPGVIFLTMVDLYRRIGEISNEKLCDVAVSYLEVYNENIRDLLAPSGLLAVREDPEKGVVVSGLSLHKPRSADELLRMLEYGNRNRTQHPTDANAQSSRSHAVFQVFVRQKDRTANISTDFRIAKMSLIDLAGSERATVTTNRGARFREGANINRSLLALGNCINALADSTRAKGQHIPYRNSKLTRLLKDSLGGNCRTVMIAAISPSSLTYEDTLNTLKYANRAKNIRTTLKQNVVSVDLHISRYAQIVEELRTEVSELKVKLQCYESGALKVSVPQPPPRNDGNDEQVHRLQLELHKVFVQRGSIRKELLELESSDRDLTIKISRKHLMVERLRLIHGGSAQGDKTMGRFERVIAASEARQARLRQRKPAVEARFKDNEAELEKVQLEIRGEEQGDGQTSEVLQECLRTRHLEIELKDCRRQIKHLKRFARHQDSHQQSSERLIVNLISMVRKQYFLLKGSGLATTDVTTDFEALQKQVEGDREVAWADQSMSEVADSNPNSAAAAGVDLNYLLLLPVMRCVDSTPKAPSRSPRKKKRRSSIGHHTPAKGVNTPIRPEGTGGHRGTPAKRINTPMLPEGTGGHHTPAKRVKTPVQSEGSHMPTQNSTPAQRGSAVKIGDTHPPSRLPTPSRHTPGTSARRTITESDTNSFHPIPTNRLSTNVGVTSNTSSLVSISEVVGEEGSVPFVRNEENVVGRLGETVTKTKQQSNQSGEDITETEGLRVNLAGTFEMEGISPLTSPPTCGQPQLDNNNHDTVNRINESPSLAVTLPEGTSNSDMRPDSQKPVARVITFDQENVIPNQKISPVTGRVMSYAEILTTPQRLDAKAQQRAPFTVITNNSPQLQNRPNTMGNENQCNGSQSTSKSTKRGLQRKGAFTKRNAPLHHRRSKSHGIIGEVPFSFQEAKHADTLHRFGLPSMADQPAASVRKAAPAYMSLTASAANKRRNYGRGLPSSQENQPPADHKGPIRLQRAESLKRPPLRIPSFNIKSRSVSNLHGKANP
ncbi:kinesin-like protein KIF18A [Asterias amurensis]|uniref:kinesin-like protein KIF18A n=1 Tax=Asterias amurensis TaxID=7602 RepID=UPI003AB71582